MKLISFFTDKLSVKFALTVSVITIIALTVSGIINFNLRYNERKEYALFKLNARSKIYAEKIAAKIESVPIVTFESMSELFTDKTVLGADIEILKTDSEPFNIYLSKNNEGEIVNEKIRYNNVFFQDEIYAVHNYKPLALVKIYYSDYSFNRTNSSYLKNMFIGILITGGFILVCIAIAFRFMVTKPVESINHFVREISLGDMKAYDVKKTDEIARLAMGFNFMVLRLKKAFERLQQQNADLEETVSIRSKELIQAEKMASLGELVAGVSHEINTPVGICITAVTHLNSLTKNVIKSFESSSLTKTALSNYILESAETAEIIFLNLTKASELVQSFKQIAADRATWEKRRFELKEYISEVLISLKPKIKNLPHVIEYDAADEIEIESFPGAFSQIIVNLVMNSIIHAFDKNFKGLIRINIVELNGYVILTLSDNGKGIEEDKIDRIFEPFYTTRRGQGGTGLGLNIVYNLVTKTLLGSIHCYSVKGKGTSFVLKLPAEHSFRE
jgi:signal transduction histidine kinase